MSIVLLDSWLCWQAEFLEANALNRSVWFATSSRSYNLIRFFGSINGNGFNGYGSSTSSNLEEMHVFKKPKEILQSINKTTLQGSYNERGLRRFDLVLATAGDCISRATILALM